MFLENSLGRNGLGVRNGDRGTVLEAKPNLPTVQLGGGTERTVMFSPKAYRALDYSNACTVHKSQGASVDAAVLILDRSARRSCFSLRQTDHVTSWTLSRLARRSAISAS